MKSARFDHVSKELATGTTRRRAIVALGALALSGAGILGLSQTAAPVRASTRCERQCAEFCLARASNKQCFKRCKRQCNDR